MRISSKASKLLDEATHLFGEVLNDKKDDSLASH
jgi:hypothetical protein